MKVIVISGACSNIGKTTVARRLQSLLERATFVKIGHGDVRPEISNRLYPMGTSFETIRENHADAEWLLIESNAILLEIQPDLLIYMDGPNPKPSAKEARVRADIVSGLCVDRDSVTTLAARLGITVELTRQIVEIAGGKL
ncbi:MAG: hypothetical protein JSW27_04535 [Phycisphaerales bacterium]|nr:MAG: hypothetical protein JSW27_04535 [Phycisphaerales bacterium]